MKIETSTRPDHDELVKIIGEAMNAAHQNGQRRGQAAFNALFHAYPEAANAIRNLDRDVMDADVFYVLDKHPDDPKWANFWYVIGRLYGLDV